MQQYLFEDMDYADEVEIDDTFLLLDDECDEDEMQLYFDYYVKGNLDESN